MFLNGNIVKFYESKPNLENTRTLQKIHKIIDKTEYKTLVFYSFIEKELKHINEMVRPKLDKSFYKGFGLTIEEIEHIIKQSFLLYFSIPNIHSLIDFINLINRSCEESM